MKKEYQILNLPRFVVFLCILVEIHQCIFFLIVNFSNSNNDALNKYVYDYVMQGGALVASLFANMCNTAFCLSDQLLAMYPLTSKEGTNHYSTPRMQIDGKHDKFHPLMKNIKSLANVIIVDCQAAHTDTVVVASSFAQSLLTWFLEYKNGTPAIAYRKPPQSGVIVALNFVACSEASFSNFFKSSTDCDKAMVNAIYFAMHFDRKPWQPKLFAMCAKFTFTNITFEFK